MNATFYGCRAWKVQPTRESANSWRAEVPLAAAERTPHVMTIPLHRISSLWWSAHVGMNLDQLGLPSTTPYDRYEVPDCTHFCASPFLYQPLWWALAKVAAPRLLLNRAI